ncbi:helix-turn-helix domain-containing protein [Pseudomonas sp. MOB-449]|nr:helix-turn-helix domain-containing protein [Pseudomonas sp. MOB-449]
MEVREAFGQALRLARLQKGLSQEDFSGVSSRTNVSLLERGGTCPTLEKLESLCSLLDVHPVSLLALTYLWKEGYACTDELLTRVSNELATLLSDANSTD